MNIIIFGSGGVGVEVKHKLEEEGNRIIAFCDNNEKKWGTVIEGIEIIAPDKIDKDVHYDLIAIGAYKGCESIKKQLMRYGVSEKNIIIPIKPPAVLFPNPLQVNDDLLEIIQKDEYESKSTKEYQKLGIEITDKSFLDKLGNLKRTLLKNRIPREKVCVVSGGVLQAYGLRESEKYDDIDIIMTSDLREIYGKELVIVSECVEMHVQNSEIICDDDIILNPKYHFIFDDLKFMNLNLLYEGRKRKISSDNFKISIEIALIEKYLDNVNLGLH